LDGEDRRVLDEGVRREKGIGESGYSISGTKGIGTNAPHPTPPQMKYSTHLERGEKKAR